MIFNQNQIVELLNIISRHQIIFIANKLGTSILSSSDIKTLKSFGIDISKLPKEGIVENAFRFGILSEALGNKKTKEMTYEQIKKLFSSGQFIPLNQREQFVLDSIKSQALSSIKGLGSKIGQDIVSAAAQASSLQRSDYEQIIRDEAIETVKNRESVKTMVSNIGHKTGEWSRDFDRISDYVLHTSYDEGRAASIERGSGKEALCFKDVYQGACKHCVRLYLTNGIGSKPIVFKLSELIANGTNIGRKTADLKPVVGSTHPYCRCTLEELPEGFEWDEDKKLFVLSTTFVRKVNRKTKIKIKVGEKEYEI